MRTSIIFTLILLEAAIVASCGMSEAEVLKRARIRKPNNFATKYKTYENVKTFKEVFSSKNWDDTLTEVDDKYSYDAMLRAVARFPDFCGGTKSECKLELAFVFGHMTQETGNGVWDTTFKWHTEKEDSANGKAYRDANCGPSCDVYPPVPDIKYIGRGSKQLSWNYNYGMYSQIMAGGKDTLLKNPEKVLNKDHIITSGLWFYMTPQSPKPSMHDIVLGCWTPPSTSSLKLNKRFAWTTKVINGAQECSDDRAEDDNRHETRFSYFKKWAEYFGLTNTYNENEFKDVDCQDSEYKNYGDTIEDMKLYWQKDAALTTANNNCGCEITKNTTPYIRYKIDGETTPTGGLNFCEQTVCKNAIYTGEIKSSKCRTGEKTWGTCAESFYKSAPRCGKTWWEANIDCSFRCQEDNHCDGDNKCMGGVNPLTDAQVENKCQSEDAIGVQANYLSHAVFEDRILYFFGSIGFVWCLVMMYRLLCTKGDYAVVSEPQMEEI